MAHSLSAKKRIRQDARRRLRNRDRKKILRVEVKKFTTLLDKKDVTAAQAAVAATVSTLDRIGAKGTVHKNTIARKKSRLMKRLNSLKAGKA